MITLKCKILNKSQVYPTCILPFQHYKLNIDINQLVDKENCIVVRRSSKPENETFDELGFLRENIISEKDVPNLSMNLYGSKFTNKHLKFRCIGNAIKLWEGEKIILSKYKEEYSILDINTPIYFHIKDLHNKVFPYFKTNDKETKNLVQLLGIDFKAENEKVEFKGKSGVKHTPNKLNYWHIELIIKDIQDNEITKANSAWKLSAAYNAYKDIVIQHAKDKAPNEIYNIPNELFIK